MATKLIVLFCLVALVYGVDIEEDPDNTRIVGGQDAEPGQFKYMASLRSAGSHFCGGTILTVKTILTAAHCKVGEIVHMTAVLGALSLGGGGIEYRVSQFIQHENWNPSTLENDIGLVIVNSLIAFNDLIQPLSLPSYDIGDGVAVVASGWGLTSYPGSLPNKLQWITLRTIAASVCKSMHAGELFSSQICTLTKQGEGVCSGDSGGPLVVNSQVHGIASAAYLCATGLPDFFTRVNSFKGWLANNVQ